MRTGPVDGLGGSRRRRSERRVHERGGLRRARGPERAAGTEGEPDGRHDDRQDAPADRPDAAAVAASTTRDRRAQGRARRSLVRPERFPGRHPIIVASLTHPVATIAG